jgi:hypothetical protein
MCAVIKLYYSTLHFTSIVYSIKILISAVNRYLWYLITIQRSLINMLNSMVPRTHPCGTPERTSKGSRRVPKIFTEDYWLVR